MSITDGNRESTGLCELCDKPGATLLGGRLICSACCEVSGSCCAEFLETDEDAERIKRIAREVAGSPSKAN